MPSKRKKCPGCGRTRDRDKFWRNAAKADGLQDQCIECMKADRKAHPEARQAFQKIYQPEFRAGLRRRIP